MPSAKPIYSARLDPEEIGRLEAVRKRAAVAKGMPVSQASLLRLAIPLLEFAFPALPEAKKKLPKKTEQPVD